MRTILVLNGPNLGLLGAREPHIYGTTTLLDLQAMMQKRAAQLDLVCEFRQSDHEGELVGWLLAARTTADGVILNPAALTHYSMALRDAVVASGLPVIEVHLSNIYAREPWRARSVISGVAAGVIAGLGIDGYLLGLEAIAAKIDTGGR